MSGRHPALRMLVMMVAALQLLSPGFASIAHGVLARETASEPLTHVESTTTAKCPVVHAPDCGVCRYLSTAGTVAREADVILQDGAASSPTCAEVFAPASGRIYLPDGRAPPVL